VTTLATADIAAIVDRTLQRHGNEPGPLLNVLHGVQEALGWIPDEAVALIAHGLNLSRADVHGVVSFYHYFRRTPPGRHVIYVCRAEACQSMQARALEAHAQQRLGVAFHQTTADGAFTLEPVYCLGNCALSPAVMIDGELHGRVTPARFDQLLAETDVGR
jgi:formate dehydrogenase subunit gamma